MINWIVIEDDFGNYYECDENDYKAICEQYPEIGCFTTCLNDKADLYSSADELYNELKYLIGDE